MNGDQNKNGHGSSELFNDTEGWLAGVDVTPNQPEDEFWSSLPKDDTSSRPRVNIPDDNRNGFDSKNFVFVPQDKPKKKPAPEPDDNKSILTMEMTFSKPHVEIPKPHFNAKKVWGFLLYLAVSLIAGMTAIIIQEAWLVPLILDQFALGVYVCIISYSQNRIRTVVTYMLIVAAVFGGMTLLRMILPKAFASASSSFLAGIVVQIFFIVGMMFILIPINNLKRKKSICTEEVRATVVDYKHTYRQKNRHYTPVFEYFYGGKLYTSDSDDYAGSKKYQIGYDVFIRINPDEPEMVYDKKYSTESAIFTAMFGLCFALGALVISTVLFMT